MRCISPYIGGQNLSLEPVPRCLQWVTLILPSRLRCGSRIPGCPSPWRKADRGPVGAAAPSARTPAHPNSAVAQGPAFRQVNPDIAGTVAAMTEGDLGVESERASHNTLG